MLKSFSELRYMNYGFINYSAEEVFSQLICDVLTGLISKEVIKLHILWRLKQ